MFKSSFSQKVLKRLYKRRELSVEEFVSLFPRVFNDHRDFYIAANLINNGYIGRYVISRPTGQAPIKWPDQDAMELAVQLHFCSTAGNATVYKMPHSEIPLQPPAETLKDPFYCTAKTDLFFQEMAEKRAERLFAISIAILAAVSGAFFTTIFTRFIG